jgi:hypothetical protein
MTHDVGQCLLRDRERGHLDGGGQGRHRVRRVDRAGQPRFARAERRRLLAQRTGEAELVECRRA